MSTKRLWAGRVLSALPALFMLTSGINIALVQTPDVRASFAKFGYPEGILPGLGVVEFVCAALYLIPQTSVLGAILLTGYLGGATATHVRVSDPVWIVPVTVGVLIWAGVFLRDERLGALVPLRRKG
jgi:DoxX-like family